MHPELIQQLDTPITRLPWVGSATAKKLARIGIETMFDLLKHLPTGVLFRRVVQNIGDASPDELIVVPLKIIQHLPPVTPRNTRFTSTKRIPYIIEAMCVARPVRLVFFNIPTRSYLTQAYPVGATVTVTGRLEFFHGIPSFTHPEIFYASRQRLTGYEPIYPLTAGITLPMMQSLIQRALARCPDMPEWMSAQTQNLLKALPWKQALQTIHYPQGGEDVSPLTPCRQRLAFDELLANQLALLSIRRAQKHRQGRAFSPSLNLRRAFLKQLPFTLTGDQQKVVQEIDQDLASPEPMMRLLQGDVGSGKTVVAMMTMLSAIEQGAQAALMAPTEILARQHAKSLMEWAENLDIKAAILTGRDKGKARQHIVEGVASGEIKLLIGTHALIQEDVIFKDLGIVVIDEQHRFGVEQRLRLVEKGHGVNVLSMTATPIPRTLMLASYGDLDCSYLRERPALRKDIETRTYPLKRLDEVIAGLGRAIAQGHRIYWVCPLVEESEVMDLAAAEDRFAALDQLFPGEVGLVHGRMKEVQKSEAMDRFKSGKIKILVATTVIEVGVDVPDATIMVIEHAERFGLAQLHQLRGRVGRGERAGICMLLYHPALTPVARSRLAIMRNTNDGFRIAEEDLKLRGSGDLAGLRQSGLPPFAFADLTVHQDLLKLAHREAEDFLREDPYFRSPRGQALKTLLYLFKRQESLRFLSAV